MSLVPGAEVWATGQEEHREIEAKGVIWDAYWIPVGGDLYLHYAFDVTQARRAAREREQLVRRLEENNADLQQFAYAVSHDLKSPLITIGGFLGLLKQDIAAGKPAASMQGSIATIENAVEKMSALLTDVLRLSRVAVPLAPPSEVSLSAAAEEAVQLVAGQIRQRGVEVIVAPICPRSSSILAGYAKRCRT